MTALDQIAGNRSPSAILDLLAREPSLRAPRALEGLAAELVREAETTNAYAAERRTQQAEFVLEVARAVEQLRDVDTLAQLVDVYDDHDFLFAETFWSFVRLLTSDGAPSRAMQLHDALVNAAENMPALRDHSVEELRVALRAGEVLADPSFHRWLVLRHRIAVRTGNVHATVIAQLLEWLVTLCRLTQPWTAVGPVPAGMQAFHMPSAQAEAWFLMRPDLHEDLDELIARTSLGELALAVALEIVVRRYAFNADAECFFAAYFLEHVLLSGDDALLAPALGEYRALCSRSENAHVRATTALRFGTALVVYWRRAAATREQLEDAADLLASTRTTVDPARSPRLARDLHFTRARLLECIGIWTPASLAAARTEFELGLAIRATAHERAPRGRALGGLANVLSALSRRGDRVDGEEIFCLYDESLSLLGDENTIDRAIVLNNYAVALLEERATDRPTNIERALVYLEEGLDLLNPLPAEPAWATDVLANLHLTRGNALRERAYGGVEERLRAARDAFINGRRYATETSDLAGLLRLNQAFVCEELFALLDDAAFEDEAYRCLVDAEERFSDRPLLAAMASFAQASIVHAHPTADSVATARNAVHRLREQGHVRELAWRAHTLGRMLRRSGEPILRSEGTALFEEALRINRELQLTDHLVGVARDLAEAELVDALPDLAPEVLEKVEALLTEAAQKADDLWTRVRTVEWRLSTTAPSDVHGDLAWIKAKRSAPVDEVLQEVCLSKNRELLDHTRFVGAGLADRRLLEAREAQLRAQQAERERWLAQSAADPTRSVFAQAEEVREPIERARDIEALIAGETETMTAEEIRADLTSFFVAHPNTIVIDFTVGSFGSVIVIASSASISVQTADLTSRELTDALNVWRRARLAWRDACFVDRKDTYDAWNAATASLLSLLSARLCGPLMNTSFEDRDILFIAGSLGGLPLHALTIGNTRLLVRCRSVSFGTNLTRLPNRPLAWRAPAKTICILSDPAYEGRATLTSSPQELARVANRLQRGGSHVTVLASVDTRVGRDAFVTTSFAVGVRVESERPTPQLITAVAPDFDAIVYSGHGMPNGLLLVNEAGGDAEWRIEDVLGLDLAQKRPFVHLSACSTASEASAQSNEMASFASWLVRAGAREVLAGAWEVGDAASAEHTETFYDGLNHGADLRVQATAASRRLRDLKGDEDLVAWSAFQLILGR